MTDNARIDEWKLIEQLREALGIFAEQASEFPADVPDLKQTNGWSFQVRDFRRAKNALDALARRSILEQPEAAGSLHVLFDGPPSHESGRFVEVEDDSGKSVRAGEWVERSDGLWDLVIPRYAPPPMAGAGWKQGMEEAAEIVTKYALDEAQGGMKTILAQKMAKSIRNRIVAASPVPDNTDARGAIGGTVAIKPLEWSELENGDFVAETIGEDYRVQAGIWASGWYWTKGEMASSAYPFFDEADEAKAAAQADYASRILSAIIPGTDASGVIEQLREALKPFATTAEQLDRPLPSARNGRVTIVHPLDDVVPELRGMTDHECPEWPLPDDMEIISAWRYHDPVPLSEHIVIQMVHLRAARDVLASLEVRAALDPVKDPKP